MRLVASPKKGKAYFFFDYDPVIIEVARNIPSHRKWNKALKCWELKITEPAIKHILRFCPTCKVDHVISEYLLTIEEKRQDAREAKASSQGLSYKDIRDYKFKTTPFDHQAQAFMRSREAENFALFMEQGTGKTKVIIDTAAWLYLEKKIDTLIVACPNSVKTNWVVDEFGAHCPDWVEYDAAYWSSTATVAEKAQLEKLNEPNGKLKVFVVNIEGLSTKRAADFTLKLAKLRNPLFVVDESSRIKKWGAARSKTCRNIAKHCNYKRIMSGTPVTQGPMDLFSQFCVLSDDILGHTSYYSMRNRYCIMGGFEDKQVLAYKNLDELWELIDPYSYRVLKKECLDLPEKLYQKVVIEQTPEQTRAYKNMKKEMATDLQDGSITTATIALTKLQKLQQINSNFVKNTEGTVVTVDEKKNPRLDALLEVLESHGGKAIIWSRYRYDIELITSALNKNFGAGKAAAFYGGVNEQDRLKIRQDFQDRSNELDFFVGNPEAGGIGLTLTEATLVIYYTNDFSLESRLQSEDRAHRIGQTKNVTYIDFVTHGTVDEKIVTALRNKRSVAALVTKDNLSEWI